MSHYKQTHIYVGMDYIARPTSENDLHDVGGFLLMCAEMNLAIPQ